MWGIPLLQVPRARKKYSTATRYQPKKKFTAEESSNRKLKLNYHHTKAFVAIDCKKMPR